MNEDLRKVIETSTLILHPEKFVYTTVKSLPQSGSHFFISRDNDEITVITKKENPNLWNRLQDIVFSMPGLRRHATTFKRQSLVKAWEEGDFTKRQKEELAPFFKKTAPVKFRWVGKGRERGSFVLDIFSLPMRGGRFVWSRIIKAATAFRRLWNPLYGRRLMIIGGLDGREFVVKNLKAKGVKVVLVDRPGSKWAPWVDEFIPAPMDDPSGEYKGLLRVVDEYLKDHKIDGEPWTYFDRNVVAWARNRYRQGFITEKDLELLLIARDKGATRVWSRKKGFLTPRFYRIEPTGNPD